MEVFATIGIVNNIKILSNIILLNRVFFENYEKC